MFLSGILSRMCPQRARECIKERDEGKTRLLASAELKDTCTSCHLHLAFYCTTLHDCAL